MKLADISEVLSVNNEKIEIVLYPVRNAKVSRSSHAYETIRSKVAYARKRQKFYDFTNDRDGIKSLMVFSSGIVIATSLTREKIALLLSQQRRTKVRNVR